MEVGELFVDLVPIDVVIGEVDHWLRLGVLHLLVLFLQWGLMGHDDALFARGNDVLGDEDDRTLLLLRGRFVFLFEFLPVFRRVDYDRGVFGLFVFDELHVHGGNWQTHHQLPFELLCDAVLAAHFQMQFSVISGQDFGKQKSGDQNFHERVLIEGESKLSSPSPKAGQIFSPGPEDRFVLQSILLTTDRGHLAHCLTGDASNESFDVPFRWVE